MWLSLWTRPKKTIRKIIETNPKKHFWTLATLYALALSFSSANLYSWGIHHSFGAILLLSVLLSPLAGFVWLYFQAYLFYWSAKILGGKAPIWHVRAALAWSRTPYLISLTLWLILLCLYPEKVFIQYTVGFSALFILLISLMVNIWAICLLIQFIREIERFSFWRAFCTFILAWVCSFLIFLITSSVIRYIYINYF